MTSTGAIDLWELRMRGRGGGFVERTGLTTLEVSDLLYRGKLQGEDQARRPGESRWIALAEIDHFDGQIPQEARRGGIGRIPEEGLDMTPMIDVTFLLLIFFMITASFHLQKGLDFPAAQTEDPQQQASAALPGLPSFDDRIVLEIDDADRFRFKDAVTGESGAAIDPEGLIEALRQKSAAEQKGQLLILPHESSSHEAVVAAIDASAQAGIVEISIADVTSHASGSAAGPPTILRTH